MTEPDYSPMDLRLSREQAEALLVLTTVAVGSDPRAPGVPQDLRLAHLKLQRALRKGEFAEPAG